MPSVQDVLAHQARDDRLSFYSSPRFCRRSRLDNELVREKPDEFGWLRAFDPKRCVSSKLPPVMASSKTPPRPASACMIGRTRTQSDADSASLSDKDCSNSIPRTPPIDGGKSTTNPTQRRNRRPISLVMDNHKSLSSLDVNSNDNYPKPKQEREVSTGSPRSKKFLSVERSAVESLSKSCGDLRQGDTESPSFMRQLHQQLPDPLRCPIHL